MDEQPAKMLSRVDGAVGHMIFNNPEKHNAVSLDMWDLAEGILDRFEHDDAIRVVVLSGAGGKSFVSGADISKFEKERSSEEAVAHYNARTKKVYARLLDYPKPLIAMVNGYCIGGGLNIAVVSDIRFCSEKSQFAMPAAKLGLGYAFASIKRLMDVVGPPAARHLMFSAARIDAAEAYRIGFVQKVLAEDELEKYVADYAAGIAANAPLTVKAMKRISCEVLKDPAERNLALCDEMVAACFASEDYTEGRKAFMEKRVPEFKGR